MNKKFVYQVDNNKKSYKNECFDFTYNFCLKHLILGEIRRDTVTNYTGLHVMYPFYQI